MTRATLAKLLILVILVFIVCLPEFFILSRGSKVNFLCLPYPPCEGGDAAAGRSGRPGGSDTREPECSSGQAAQWQRGKEVCTQENRGSLSLASDSDRNWFVCETDLDMAELQQNLSSSAFMLPLEVSVELHLGDAEELNFTLYGLGNRSSLQPHPPGEEEEEEDRGRAKVDNRQGGAFYCCLPTSDPAEQSRCLLWLANRTALMATQQQPPSAGASRDDWQCALRVLWLVLLGVVLLLIFSAVLEQIFIHKKAKVRRAGWKVTTTQFKGRIADLNATQLWADDIGTLLDGTVDHSNTAHLHHRSHHTTSTDTDGTHIL